MQKIFSLFLTILVTTSLWAYDFQSGELYYNITNDTVAPYTVEVTSKSSDFPHYNEGVTFATATIPASVTYNGTTYSVTSIGRCAFSFCYSLSSVIIPNSVTSIGEYAFSDCFRLTSITIPNKLTSIGAKAFSGCSSLTSVVWNAEDHSDYSTSNSPFYDVRSQITSFAFGDNVKHIPASLCYGMESLTSITIPNSVTSIGNYAFGACKGLTLVTIGNGVTSIGFNAFYSCSSMSSIIVESGNSKYDSRNNCNAIINSATNALIVGCQNTLIPNSVTSIESLAFSLCSGLTSVTIPNSVTNVEGDAFWFCEGLTSIVVESGNSKYDSRNNCNAIIETATNTLIAGCQNTVIPNNLASIGNNAFNGCSGLTSVTIPDCVTSIGRYAFWYCKSLTSVKIGNSVTSIGTYAFCGCKGLTAITLPSSLTSIDYGAFGDCVNIKELYLEQSTPPSLGGDAFISSPTAYIPCGTEYVYRNSKWNDYISEFEEYNPLIYYGTLGNITWQYDNGGLLIAGMGAMDTKCNPWEWLMDSIQSIEIANGITSIPESAFANYKILNKVTLPSTLEEIGANAFADCKKLYDIYSYAEIPPAAEVSSFTNYNAFLHVPCDAQRYYKADMVFSKFYNQECISSDKVSTDDIVINPGSTDVTITWPTEDNADTYTIVIKKGDEIFCTLTFNADGQLLNIAFAPGRGGSHAAPYALQTISGYRFTVTGLTEATKYAYDITTKDATKQTIAAYSGEFTTKGGTTTAVEDILQNTTNTQKLLRNGQLIILRDGKTYTTMGAEIQ